MLNNKIKKSGLF